MGALFLFRFDMFETIVRPAILAEYFDEPGHHFFERGGKCPGRVNDEHAAALHANAFATR